VEAAEEEVVLEAAEEEAVEAADPPLKNPITSHSRWRSQNSGTIAAIFNGDRVKADKFIEELKAYYCRKQRTWPGIQFPHTKGRLGPHVDARTTSPSMD